MLHSTTQRSTTLYNNTQRQYKNIDFTVANWTINEDDFMKELTKKEIAEKFGVHLNTVSSTLALIGVNTKKGKHPQGEVDNFALANQMSKEGKSQNEIRDYFAQLDEQVLIQELHEQEFDADEFAVNQAQEASDTFNRIAATTLSDLAEDSVDEMLPHLSELMLYAINKKVNSQEVIDAIRAQKKKSKGASGASFLLQKMQVKTMMPNQQKLNGKEQKQLPQASPENSAEEL